ncbi:MAG: hypothetical protein OXF93_16155 [Acidobacteria bacterium]|nr:hypothetical protein [Acidobacteriota bacterium]
MTHRVLAATVAAAVLALAPVTGQQLGTGEADYTAPTTPWGDPDLQGFWDTRTYTPFERPAEFGMREFMTEEEAAERERLGLRRVVSDDDDDAVAQQLVEQDVRRYARSDAPDDGRPGYRIAGAEYNAFWSADPTQPGFSLRTSQVIDPPDGHMPPLTRAALEQWEAREEARRDRSQGDDWEDRGLSERCLTRNGLPGEMLGSSQQPLKEIIQSPGHVSIVMPYGFVRIIPVTDQVPLDPAVRQWNGDSRGRWEGDTLVVETANFKETVNNAVPAHGGPFGGSAHVHYYPGTGETLRLTERFRRIDANTLEYHYTVEDPNVFVRPWSAVNYFTLDPWATEGNQDRLFEYACHEHNYGMTNAIRGARVDRQWALDEALREAAIREGELEEKWGELLAWEEANPGR